MRVYKPYDIRGYPFCCYFVIKFKDIVKYNYEKSKQTYFKNVLNDLIWIYKLKIKNEIDKPAIKYYEGILKQLYYYIDSLRLIRGIPFTSNKVFDYDNCISRCESQLSIFLENGQKKFAEGLYISGAFHVGQYFGNKEIIKVCKKFKYEE